MKKTTSLYETLTTIHQQKDVLVYISMPNCSICRAISPRIEKMLESFDISAYHLNAKETPEVASYFEVLTAPAILVFNYEKEVFRQARFIDFVNLERLLKQIAGEAPLDYEQLFK